MIGECRVQNAGLRLVWTANLKPRISILHFAVE